MFLGSLDRICRYLHIDMKYGFRIFAQVKATDLNLICMDIHKQFADYRISRKNMRSISWALSHKTLNKLDQMEYENITAKVRQYFDDKYSFSINYDIVKLN